MRDNFKTLSVSSNDLADDYDYCQKITQKYSKSFYYAFSKLPRPEAQAIYAVYAFCRTADDAVDHEPDKAKRIANLDRLTHELTTFETEDINQPMWRALKDVFSRYAMNKEPFFEQLAGQRMDIDFKQPETLLELETYSDYVAGSVGRMLLPILTDEVTSAAEQSAFDLGVAMQITNILRDIGEDYRDNERIYLPQQMMAETGYTEAKLAAVIIDDSFITLWERLAERAEILYDCFQNEIEVFATESRLPLLASAYVYRGILDEVRRHDYNCLTKRQAVSAFKKERYYRDAKVFLKNR